MTARPKTDDAAPISVIPYLDYETARSLLIKQWGDDALVIGGKAHTASEMTLKAAFSPDGKLGGVAYYRMSGMVALLGAIVVTDGGRGMGTALFNAVADEARAQKMKRLRAITTNDNFEAMAFFQKRGMRFMSMFPGGVDAYRAFKPGLRELGFHGIVCRDVFELELDL